MPIVNRGIHECNRGLPSLYSIYIVSQNDTVLIWKECIPKKCYGYVFLLIVYNDNTVADVIM